MDILMPDKETCNRNDDYEYLLLTPTSQKDAGKTIEKILGRVPVAYHVFGSGRIESFHPKKDWDMSVLVAEFLELRRLTGNFDGKLPVETYKIVPYNAIDFHGLHFEDLSTIDDFLEDYHPYLEVPEDLQAA